MTGQYEDNPNSRRWFAVMVKSRHEKSAAAMLLAQNLPHFLPLRSEIRQWSDRRQVLELPLFGGYLFAQMDTHFDTRLAILQTPGILGFVCNHAGPVPVPDAEIDQLRAFLSTRAEYSQLPYLVEGDLVRVMRGPLEGIEGKLLRGNSSDRLILSIELLRRSLSVQVSRDDVVLVDDQVPRQTNAINAAYSLAASS